MVETFPGREREMNLILRIVIHRRATALLLPKLPFQTAESGHLFNFANTARTGTSVTLRMQQRHPVQIQFTRPPNLFLAGGPMSAPSRPRVASRWGRRTAWPSGRIALALKACIADWKQQIPSADPRPVPAPHEQPFLLLGGRASGLHWQSAAKRCRAEFALPPQGSREKTQTRPWS